MSTPAVPEKTQVQPEPPQKRSRAALWVALAGVVIVLVLLFVTAMRTRARAQCTSCRNNLSSVGIAMYLYADENDSWFPPDLDLLYPQYDDNLRTFLCPSTRQYGKGIPSGSISGWSSFVYLPGRDTSCPGPFHLMHDKPGNHGGGFNALRVESCTEWWPASRAAEFLRRVELENEAVARWRASGRPAEGVAESISPELQDLMKRPVPKLQYGKATW